MYLTASGNQRASKTSAIQVGFGITGHLLAFASWDIKVDADDQPTRNFQSYQANGLGFVAAWAEAIIGFYQATINMGGDWDASYNPTDGTGYVPPTGAGAGSPSLLPGIFPRDDLKVVAMYPSLLDFPTVSPYSFPVMRVRSTAVGANIPSSTNITFAASGFNQGAFSFPAGQVATSAGPG